MDRPLTPLRTNTMQTDGNCMTESATQQQWNNLVSLKYGNLDRDIKAMVTVDGVTNKLLLAELGWALSRKQFDGLIKGKPSTMTPGQKKRIKKSSYCLTSRSSARSRLPTHRPLHLLRIGMRCVLGRYTQAG